MKIVPPTSDGVREAAEVIRDGGIVAYPTETVYGLAANPFCVPAIDRIFSLKGRNSTSAILLVIGSISQLTYEIANVTPRDMIYIHTFWPGPLSILLHKCPGLPDIVTAAQPKVCVRWTSHPVASALCMAVGTAITSTSANRTGKPPARSLEDLDLPGLDLAIDGGTLAPSPPSTVFDPETETVIRPGAISEEALVACRRPREFFFEEDAD